MKAMADMVIYFLQKMTYSVLRRPLDIGEGWEELPPPMHPGNEIYTGSICIDQNTLQSVMVDQQGFSYVNEGTEERPRKGYVTLTPNSYIKFRVNTSLPSSSAQKRLVHVGYLHSYTPMVSQAPRK